MGAGIFLTHFEGPGLCRLTKTETNGYQNALLEEFKELAILKPIRVDTPSGTKNKWLPKCLVLKFKELAILKTNRFDTSLGFAARTKYKP